MPLTLDANRVYATILDKLRRGERFAFSRFGDGEFNCIFGKRGQNCDGHQYFPDLGRALRAVLESRPDYLVGVQGLARRVYKGDPEFEQLVDFPYVDADALHKASQGGMLSSLFRALGERETVIVGPSHIGKLSFPFVHQIISPRNCWEDYGKILVHCRAQATPGRVFVFCASMPAKVLIHELSLTTPCTLIDAGSVFDPYCGVKSRRYHHKLILP
jgi:hypothetical protein